MHKGKADSTLLLYATTVVRGDDDRMSSDRVQDERPSYFKDHENVRDPSSLLPIDLFPNYRDIISAKKNNENDGNETNSLSGKPTEKSKLEAFISWLNDNKTLQEHLWRVHDNKTPLLVAIEKGYREVALELATFYPPEALLVQNENGETALHLAFKKRSSDLVKTLVNRHPEDGLLLSDSENSTTLYLAIINGYPEQANQLAKKYPLEKLFTKYFGGNSILHLVSFFRMSAVLQTIYKRVSEIDQNDNLLWRQYLSDENEQGLTAKDCYGATNEFKKYFDKFPNHNTRRKSLTLNNSQKNLEKSYNNLENKTLCLKNMSDDKISYIHDIYTRQWNPLVALLFNVDSADPKNTENNDNESELQLNGLIDISNIFVMPSEAEIPSRWQQKHGDNPEAEINITKLLTFYTQDSYEGKNFRFEYEYIKKHFTQGNLKERAIEFDNALYHADIALYRAICKAKKLKPGNDLDDETQEDLNEIVNTLKADIHLAIYEKQKEQRSKRWDKAKLLMIITCVIFPVSYIGIFIWYQICKYNEPYRSTELTKDEFLNLYSVKYQGNDGISTATDILEALSKKDAFKGYHDDRDKARKVIISTGNIIQDNSEYESDLLSEKTDATLPVAQDLEYVPLLSDEETDDTVTVVQILASNWNNQAKHFQDKLAGRRSHKNDDSLESPMEPMKDF